MKKYGIILGAILLLACHKENSFKGKEYIYQTSSGFSITLGFDSTSNRYFGKGVNQYFGVYNLDKNKLSFQTPSTTMMMGNTRQMAEEDMFLNTLTQVQSFEWADDNLILITKENNRFILAVKQQTFSKGMTYEK